MTELERYLLREESEHYLGDKTFGKISKTVIELLDEIEALNGLVELQNNLSDNDDRLYKELLEENKRLRQVLTDIKNGEEPHEVIAEMALKEK